ncbi:MAG: carboxypeptidase-like regulatory domain-containing protein [Ginsengibacter sp.]
MRYTSFLFCWMVFLFLSSTAKSQQVGNINGDFEGMSFDQLVQNLEATTSYHFYYDRSDLDSFVIHAKFQNSPVAYILKKIFSSTDFHFSIDGQNNIFITKRYVIQTDVTPDYFERNITAGDSAINNKLLLAEVLPTKGKLKAPEENILFEIGVKSNTVTREKAILSGYVRDTKDGEPLPGTAVYIDSSATGTITDQFGYYSLSLPRARHTLSISNANMKDTKRQVLLFSSGSLNIDLVEYVPSLKTVEVIAQRRSNVLSAQMGINKLNIKAIKQVPAILGEADVLRVILTLPGVTSAGEGSTGLNVRGGSADQNLILLNDATIYNPSHLFGFFSAFNADVIKGAELYKAGIPAKYGGRLSSVLDVTTRDGNTKNITGSGGIGVLTSKFTIEGPITKEKTSFILGGRSTYSNWILKQLSDPFYSNSKASFYDIILHVTHTINNKNNLYFTGYLSHDGFRLNNDTTYKYGNKNLSIKWKHVFDDKFYMVTTAGFDKYEYSVGSKVNPVNAFSLGFNINQTKINADFNYSLDNKNNFNFGFQNVFYKLHPGSYIPLHPQSLVINDQLQAEQALESALYFSDRYTVSSKLSIDAGLRYSLFNYLGPHAIYQYVRGLPRQEETLRDTMQYKPGKIIKTYSAPEFRFSTRYTLSDNASFKMSFSTLQQYIHMLSNTTSISPTDIWKLSDPNIKPQKGYQFSFGYYRNFKSNTIETSIEAYFKRLNNYLDYKSGAELIMNHHIETEVINTKGKVYGVELLIKKTEGKLNGWISYTYSRTWLKMDDLIAGEIINHGHYYPASFDKPHNINFIGNYRFSHRYSVSLNIVYNTGRPITLPIAVFNSGGADRLYYSDRNQYRIPEYFRTDFSMNIEGNHKVKKLTHNSWSFGVYNVLARQNAYSVYFIQNNGVVKGYKLSIFGTTIPFITYNFRF